MRVLHVAGLFRDPGPVLVDVPRVDREQIARVTHAVDGEVVDDRPARIAQERVVDLAHRQGRDVVAGQTLERGEGAGPLDLELAHVAHVEAADGGAHGAVLLDDPPILHGHFPAAEGNHPRAGLEVRREERRALQRGVHGPFSRPSRPETVKRRNGLPKRSGISLAHPSPCHGAGAAVARGAGPPGGGREGHPRGLHAAAPGRPRWAAGARRWTWPVTKTSTCS